MIRRLSRPVTVGLLAALALAACGSSGTKADSAASSTTAASSATSGSATSTASGSATSTASGGGAAGCAALTKEDLADFLVDTQLLAQINSPESIATLKEGTIGRYTPDAFAQILTKLHGAVDGHGAPGLGDPKEALTFYEQLNAAVRQMYAANPVTEAMITAYQTQSGGVQGVLSKQIPINAAVGTTCKGLA